ncbi:MAG: circularly permuted type 2 ATP-grasp protein [Candidatus Binatia bacterium]
MNQTTPSGDEGNAFAAGTAVPAFHPLSPPWPPPSYFVPDGHYDEVRDRAGFLRPVWQSFVEHAGDLSPERLARNFVQAAVRLRENGITYNVYADVTGAASRAWTVDALPFLLGAGEWEPLARGLAQRARLLEAMAADFYGERRLVAQGFVPPALVLGHPDFTRAVAGVTVPGGIRLHHVAFDLGRGPDGAWRVIGTRAQSPSGAGYALENRITVSRLFPDTFRDLHVQMLARFYRAVQNRLREAPGDPAHVVLLTPGPWSETYFEHAYLARYLGFTLAEGGDLTVRDERVWLRTLSGLEPVAGILRRLDDDFCDPLELRADSALGVPGLVGAWRAGNVVLGNAFGTGVLESPGLYGFLPPLCEHLLGQPLATASVPTWWCGEAAAFAEASSGVASMLLKPAFSGTRMEPVFLGALDAEALEQQLAAVRERPEGFVLQENVPLSHVPVWSEGGLESRAMMLRVFLVADGDGDYRVMPGGLARIAAQGSDIVSGQRGGSSKDTWVLSDAPVEHFSLLGRGRPLGEFPSRSRGLASRAAENLFWFGRYAERAENRARLLRATLPRLLDPEAFPESLYDALVGCCRDDGLLGELPDGFLPGLGNSDTGLIARVFASPAEFGISHDLLQASRAAASARDWLSSDSWRLISALPGSFTAPLYGGFSEVLSVLDHVVVSLAAVAGLETERMVRDDGWRVVAIGRNIERLVALASAGMQVAASSERDEPALLDWLLDLSDATVTYRARYRSLPDWQGVTDLLVYDDTNPRSAAYLLGKLADHVARLPEAGLDALVEEIAAAARRATDARRGTLFASVVPLHEFFGGARSLVLSLSDALALRYFRHVEGSPRSTVGI